MNTGEPTPAEPSRHSPPGATERAPGAADPSGPPQPDPSGPARPNPAPPPSGRTLPPSAGWPGPTQPHPDAAQFGAPTPGAGYSSGDDRNWAAAAHVSAIVGAWIALGFIGPLVVMLVQGPKSPFVRAHAVEALNFNLSVLIYAIVGFVLTFVLIGIPLLVALGILWLVCTVLAAVKASQGEHYRYPLTIRMVS